MDWESILVAALRLFLAAVLGGIVGWERESHDKGAGLRTHMLICIGACLFSLVTREIDRSFPGEHFDVLRVVQGLLLGIGFLCGGVIFTRKGSVRGLTTAAGLWVLTAIGLALGFGHYALAALGTALAFIVIATLKQADSWLRSRLVSGRNDVADDDEDDDDDED